MFLTAKENVFLNGSIIGYSREFLESHYDEIVEFAELSDFMEEKVKNFSSGMVSHGMNTILDNCTKCVWIEKGQLRMIGEPKVVCGEYRKMYVE